MTTHTWHECSICVEVVKVEGVRVVEEVVLVAGEEEVGVEGVYEGHGAICLLEGDGHCEPTTEATSQSTADTTLHSSSTETKQSLTSSNTQVHWATDS